MQPTSSWFQGGEARAGGRRALGSLRILQVWTIWRSIDRESTFTLPAEFVNAMRTTVQPARKFLRPFQQDATLAIRNVVARGILLGASSVISSAGQAAPVAASQPFKLLETRVYKPVHAANRDGSAEKLPDKGLIPKPTTRIKSCFEPLGDASRCGSGLHDSYVWQKFVWEFQKDTAVKPQRLETAVVMGSNDCQVWVRKSAGEEFSLRCDSFMASAGDSKLMLSAGISLGDVEGIALASLDIAAPKLQECAKIRADRRVTPDFDRTKYYRVAKDALALTYSGNWSALRIGQRFDAYYSLTDSVVAFAITQPVSVGSDGKLILHIDRLPYEADRSKTPCKP